MPIQPSKDRVAEVLRDLRRTHGLTQAAAANRVGVDVRQWHRWEKGEVAPGMRNLQTIALWHGSPVASFFDEPPAPAAAGAGAAAAGRRPAAGRPPAGRRRPLPTRPAWRFCGRNCGSRRTGLRCSSCR